VQSKLREDRTESVGAHFTQGKWRSLVVSELIAATFEDEHAMYNHIM
jgi:hypothetical protein